MAAPGGAGGFACDAGRGASLPAVRSFPCTSADVRGCSFPLAGKNQRATGGSQIETAPWLPRPPRRLVWERNLLLREAIRFLAGAAWNAFGYYVTRLLADGRHQWAALVARGVVGLSGGGYYVWTDRSGMVRFSATLHGRRSLSSLRRPPQEVAASLYHGGARKHGRSGATVGEPRPSATNPIPSPEGKVSRRKP